MDLASSIYVRAHMQAHVNRYTLLLRKNYLVEKSIIYEKETNINWESWSWKIHYLWMEGEFYMHFLLQVNNSTVREKVRGKKCSQGWYALLSEYGYRDFMRMSLN
jgi:hypothetical protein